MTCSVVEVVPSETVIVVVPPPVGVTVNVGEDPVTDATAELADVAVNVAFAFASEAVIVCGGADVLLNVNCVTGCPFDEIVIGLGVGVVVGVLVATGVGVPVDPGFGVPVDPGLGVPGLEMVGGVAPPPPPPPPQPAASALRATTAARRIGKVRIITAPRTYVCVKIRP